MRMVCVQYWHTHGPFLNDPDARVAMAKNSPLVGLGQAEKLCEIEIV